MDIPYCIVCIQNKKEVKYGDELLMPMSGRSRFNIDRLHPD